MMVPTKAPASEPATGDQTDQPTTEAVSMEPSQAGSDVVSVPTKSVASEVTSLGKKECYNSSYSNYMYNVYRIVNLSVANIIYNHISFILSLQCCLCLFELNSY